MTSKEYKEARRKKAINSQKYYEEVNLLLGKAAEIFLEGKESIVLKLPNTSEEFFDELRKTAHNEWCFDVRKRFFGRVKIFSGIIYEYPF